nr:uncharacterized protein LOC129163484 [Nothobranchius furzeri]
MDPHPTRQPPGLIRHTLKILNPRTREQRTLRQSKAQNSTPGYYVPQGTLLLVAFAIWLLRIYLSTTHSLVRLLQVHYCYWTANKTTFRNLNVEHPSPDWTQHRVKLFQRQSGTATTTWPSNINGFLLSFSYELDCYAYYEEYEEAKRLARQYLEDSQAESEREVTKRKVKNNKRYLSSSDDEAGPCSTERTTVPMAERMLLLIEPSSRDVPVSKRTTLPAESLNGEDLMATSTPRQRVTPRQKATEGK